MTHPILELNEYELMLYHTQSVYSEMHPNRNPDAMRIADSTLAMGVFLERQTMLHIQKLERRIAALEAKLNKMEEPV